MMLKYDCCMHARKCCMIYGELGGHTLYLIQTLAKAAVYWLKLVELPYDRLPKAAYVTTKIMK